MTNKLRNTQMQYRYGNNKTEMPYEFSLMFQ